MSTTAYQNNPSPTSFSKRNIRISPSSSRNNEMTNDRSGLPSRKIHFLPPISSICESSSTNSKSSVPSPSPQSLSTEIPNTNSSIKSSKQIYTISNPPRAIEPKPKHYRPLPRIPSVPNGNSPRNSLDSKSKEQKVASAPPILHSPDYHDSEQIHSSNNLLKRDKQKQKSKVPKVVQQRRVLLFFPRLSPTKERTPSPLSNDQQESPRISVNNTGNRLFSTSSKQQNLFEGSQLPALDPTNNIDPDVADSLQLYAILKNIEDDFNLNGTSPTHQQTTIDPNKYEYVVSNLLDTATFKLSPRTLKDEEISAARARFSQNYLSEMRESANAHVPDFILSIVPDNNNNTIGNSDGNESNFKFRLNPTDAIEKASSFDDMDPFESTMDREQLQLCYDATLNGFYDPKTSKYYDLRNA